MDRFTGSETLVLGFSNSEGQKHPIPRPTKPSVNTEMNMGRCNLFSQRPILRIADPMVSISFIILQTIRRTT